MNNLYIWESCCITVKWLLWIYNKVFCPTTGNNFWVQRVSIYTHYIHYIHLLEVIVCRWLFIDTHLQTQNHSLNLTFAKISHTSNEMTRDRLKPRTTTQNASKVRKLHTFQKMWLITGWSCDIQYFLLTWNIWSCSTCKDV